MLPWDERQTWVVVLPWTRELSEIKVKVRLAPHICALMTQLANVSF